MRTRSRTVPPDKPLNDSNRPDGAVYARLQRRYFVNPFATRYVRPGALPWLTEAPTALQDLAERFRGPLKSRAAIVGPHGSGKSTLLHHLVPGLGEVGAYYGPVDSEPPTVKPGGGVVWHVLRRSQRPLRQVLASRSAWRPAGVLVLDGWEQLRGWEYVWLGGLLKLSQMGLLVTCHLPCRTLGTLCVTSVTSSRLQQLVVRLISDHAGPHASQLSALAEPDLLQRLLQQERGNVREVFMRLYDLAENRWSDVANDPTNQPISSTIEYM